MKKYATIIILALAAILAACTDDDTFSTSVGNTLTFSTDTVKLDTVFSRVPSTTRTFWVYNNSGDGIRCRSVRLKSGNQTGLRVNVDGIYLGGSQGYQTSEIEIRDKDSIRVFVELTAPNNNRKGPQLIDDDLVFTLESGVEQKVNIRGYSWDADIYNNVLEISHDTTITQGDKPIILQQGLKVDSGATLTVAEGTTLYFGQRAGIDVYGCLKTIGTDEKNVVLRGDRIDRMFDYLPYDRVPGQWQGIRFHESSYDNSLDYTDLHSAYNGIVCDSSALDRTKLKAYNTTIHNCQGYGIITVCSVVDLWNCQITNTLHDCAAFYGGRATLRHCTLAQFYPFDANRGAALRFANTAGGNDSPLDISVYNSLITGYADDVLMGEISEKGKAEYVFDHCIIRTPKPTTADSTHFTNVVFENIKDTAAVTGEKHFMKIDADKQYYDFHLTKRSPAIDAGAPLPFPWSLTDRDGLKRDDRPDIGCYEHR